MRPSRTPLLDIEHATVAAPNGESVLHEVSLSLSSGEHTVILGANGSGKSTLIKLISLQYHPHTGGPRPGSIRLFGRARWNVFELRSRLGIVSGDLHLLFPTEWKALTALEAVLSGLLESFDVLPHHRVTAERRAKAGDALAWMGIAHLAERRINELSTGELRRVLIARALAPQPEALLLDEPTSGLDLVSRAGFLDALRTVAAGGKTLILVTHRVEEILPEIQRVVLLKGGRVLRDGPKAEILTNAALSETFGAPLRVERGPEGYYRAAVSSPAVNGGVPRDHA